MRVFRTYSALTCFVAGFTAACFSGCSVTPPTMKIGLALYPPADAEFETTPDAHQVVRWGEGDYRLALSPRGGLDDMLDLWLSIENHGEEALDFFPSHVQYAYCGLNAPTQRPSFKATPRPSQKPLAVIESTQPQCTSFKAIPSQTQVAAHLAQRESKRKEADNADEAAMAAAMVIFVFAIIFVVAAASSSGSSKRGGGHRQGHSYSRRQALVSAIDLVDVSQQATFTTRGGYSEGGVGTVSFIGGSLQHALAESVIAPGNRHAGHIFIPPYENATFLRLRIGLGNNATTLDFDYRPRRLLRERTRQGAR